MLLTEAVKRQFQQTLDIVLSRARATAERSSGIVYVLEAYREAPADEIFHLSDGGEQILNTATQQIYTSTNTALEPLLRNLEDAYRHHGLQRANIWEVTAVGCAYCEVNLVAAFGDR
jgi:hypothetical protein